jgi:hypothetical protein
MAGPVWGKAAAGGNLNQSGRWERSSYNPFHSSVGYRGRGDCVCVRGGLRWRERGVEACIHTAGVATCTPKVAVWQLRLDVMARGGRFQRSATRNPSPFVQPRLGSSSRQRERHGRSWDYAFVPNLLHEYVQLHLS